MSDTLLYLDTARIGRASDGASAAISKLIRLAKSDPNLAYQQVLAETQSTLIPHWQGMSHLKGQLRSLLQCDEVDREILMASSSTSLMRLAARCLFMLSGNVLTTDLAWPRFREILRAESVRTGSVLTVAKVRHLFEEGNSIENIISNIASTYEDSNCSSLFLTAVSSDGVKLPVNQVIHALNVVSETRFIVVDGAQEFANCDTDLEKRHCDLYLFSGHKWLGSYLPVTFALHGKRASSDVVWTTLGRMIGNCEMEDNLLRFQYSFETNGSPPNETSNIAPFFACAGACADKMNLANQLNTEIIRHNRKEIENSCGDSNWEFAGISRYPHSTSILMLENEKLNTITSSDLESRFREKGIQLSAYDEGRIRLSIPNRTLANSDIKKIRLALKFIDR